MPCIVHLGFMLPEEFATEPRYRASKKRDRELELVKKRGQQRRVLVTSDGEVLAADLALYEALILAGYLAIAVTFVIGHPEPGDIETAKAFSAKHPLPWVGKAVMPPGAEYAQAFRDFTEDRNRSSNS